MSPNGGAERQGDGPGGLDVAVRHDSGERARSATAEGSPVAASVLRIAFRAASRSLGVVEWEPLGGGERYWCCEPVALTPCPYVA